MTAHLRYLRYVVRHKWFVLVAGLRTGAPLWRLLIHDWSKFLPSEWGPYVEWFYNGPFGGSWDGYEDMGGEIAQAKDAFDRAWLHHQHANPHHWQHWILRDDGQTKTLPMPEHFVREMVADWMGAGRAITGRWEAADWYAANREKMVLHPSTRALVRRLLGAPARLGRPEVAS